MGPFLDRLPRMRGDRPKLYKRVCGFSQFTPHARGSTYYRSVSPLFMIVYPACAGIDRSSASSDTPRHGLPRMRGDRPVLLIGI